MYFYSPHPIVSTDVVLLKAAIEHIFGITADFFLIIHSILCTSNSKIKIFSWKSQIINISCKIKGTLTIHSADIDIILLSFTFLDDK